MIIIREFCRWCDEWAFDISPIRIISFRWAYTLQSHLCSMEKGHLYMFLPARKRSALNEYKRFAERWLRAGRASWRLIVRSRSRWFGMYILLLNRNVNIWNVFKWIFKTVGNLKNEYAWKFFPKYHLLRIISVLDDSIFIYIAILQGISILYYSFSK